MSQIVKPTKRPNVFALYDDDTDTVVARLNLNELQREQTMLTEEIDRLDIATSPAKLKIWAERYYQFSPDGQALSRSQARLIEVQNLITQINAVKV